MILLCIHTHSLIHSLTLCSNVLTQCRQLASPKTEIDWTIVGLAKQVKLVVVGLVERHCLHLRHQLVQNHYYLLHCCY